MVHPGPHPGKDLREPQGALQIHYAPPDFLSRPVALMIYMRLSLRRAAHVDVASSAK
jgi:hypothetical protein